PGDDLPLRAARGRPRPGRDPAGHPQRRADHLPAGLQQRRQCVRRQQHPDHARGRDLRAAGERRRGAQILRVRPEHHARHLRCVGDQRDQRGL
ncbi:hypothetical protein LTR94_034362, partial [Friedmanniomyces endolithicus]